MDAVYDAKVRLFVYALCEPITREIRYVGLTANLYNRLRSHCRNPLAPRVREWVNTLKVRGLIPSMIVLREVWGVADGANAEREEIAKYRELLGDQLLNEQHTGKRRKKYRRGKITFGDRSLSIREWAAELGISRQALHFKISTQPIEVALAQTGGIKSPRMARGAEEYVAVVDDASEPMKIRKGLTHEQRKIRRRMMAEAVIQGAPMTDVATQFGVNPMTVKHAYRERIWEIRREKKRAEKSKQEATA